MREIELSLNETQRIRLQTALDKLQSFSSKSTASNASVTVADAIPLNYEHDILKGHGTVELDGQVIATVCGIVERVDKLIYVRSLRSRYKPETGDILVGRVLEVSQKRWKVDINSNQDAVLMLSSVTLPDGIQRRRTATDELNMRNIFEENDVISAEVRNLQHDGTWQLHARSDKYGKLERGQLISIPSYLVKKQKQHFHQIQEYGVLLILGRNGYVWVGELTEANDSMEVDTVKDSEQNSANASVYYTSLEVNEQSYVALETRQAICRIANAVRVLSILGFHMTVEVIKMVAELSISLNLDIHDMLGAEFCVMVAEKEADRRSIVNRRKG